VAWLHTNKTDPLTGLRLPSKKLIENVSLRQVLASATRRPPSYSVEQYCCAAAAAVDPDHG
jgi:hypothetical protein